MKNKGPYRKPDTRTSFAELDMGKLPPQALELEEAVLGALMLEKEALTSVIDILKEDAFYKEGHKKIFAAIKKLFERSEPIDILTVTNELKRNDELELVGGAYYISQLTSKIASSANIEYHARIVLQKYIQRELISFSSETIENSYDETLDVFELLDAAEKRLFSIADENIKKDPKKAGTLIHEAIKQVEAARTRKGLTGVPSGFTVLDRITSGWQSSDLVILAARPSMGKTALALTFAANAAIRYNVPVAVFSLEMSNLQLAQRLMASETELGMEKLRKGQLDDREFEQLTTMVSELSEAPIYIDDTAALSVFELRAKARRLKENHNIQMILIDYLQLMTSGVEGRGSNREQEISSISRALKSLAKELNVPIIALSQLSRAVEQRGGAKRPQLSDLRESGAIEQDADMVLFVYRQDYYGAQAEGQEDMPPDSAEIIIAKHRNGPLDSVHLKFQKEFAKFVEYEPSLSYNSFSADSSDGGQTRTLPSKNWDKKNDIEEEGPF